MSLRRAAGVFRQAGNLIGANIEDTFATNGTPYNAVYTQGSQQVDNVQLTPSLTQNWKLLGLSVTAYIGLFYGAAGGIPLYGRLGKLHAALLPQGTPQTPGGPVPYAALPPDNLILLWDGSNDTAPRQVSSGSSPIPQSTLQAVSGDIQLPVPIPINAGQQVAVGLYLEPSLIGTPSATVAIVGLGVFESTYVVNYDDGQ